MLTHMDFLLPSRFDDEHLVVVNQLQVLNDIPELVLDFRPVNYVFPFATLAIAIAIRELLEKRRAIGLSTTALGTELNYGAISYLKFFGFFRAIGFPVGNAPNDAPGGSRYLPITIITLEELKNASAGRPFQIEIDSQSDRLAKVIFSEDENIGAAMMLSYCLREIIRNSFEHAGVNRCYVMAQRWPNGDAEITIADRGIGIHESLRHQHNMASVDETISLALLPGVTSGAARATGSDWDNTGFGLYVTSELGRRYGDFTLLSSNRLLKRQDNIDTFSEIPISGTIVKLRINTRDGEYFPNILKNIVADGESIAMNINGAVGSASKMSKSYSVSMKKYQD